MADVRAELTTHLRGLGAPFLFVGSGLSRRYIATDDWAGLLKSFADLTGQPYDYYRTTAGNDMPAVASAIADAFHDVWWTDDRFAASRKEWQSKTLGRESALKVTVSEHLATATANLPKSGPLANELDLLKGAVIDGIITTNYDGLLEHLFPTFDVLVGQKDVLFCPIQGVGEIYKIHGSFTEPESLVLTAADYEEFAARSSYLAAKLMTIFVEHPIIFLGYSVSDPNVIGILRSITACLTADNIQNLRDRLIFVQWDENSEPRMDEHSFVVDDLVIPIHEVTVPDFTEVFAALAGLRRAFPAQMLRRLKQHVYDLVLHDDPEQRLYVTDLDATKDPADVDVVFGVGMKSKVGVQGLVGLERWDLIDDVIDDGDQWDAEAVVSVVLPQLLRQPGNVPVFKYLRAGGYLTKDGKTRANADLDPRVVAAAEKQRVGLPTGQHYTKKAPEVLAGVSSFEALTEVGDTEVLNYGTYLAASKVDPAVLRSFLDDRRDLTAKVWGKTQYAKLACYLDWLAYGKA